MISVIIPVYNQAKELKQCFDSLLRQTFKDIEVIVVNDGSIDDIQDIFLEYSEIFKRENIHFQAINQENKGASVARNRGFLDSKGEYVIFLDADIELDKNALKEMAEILDKKPDVSYIYSSFKFGFKKFQLWQFSAEKLKIMPYIHTSSLIRRAHFPGFDESLKKFQDWDLWLQMLKMGYTGYHIPKILFKVKAGGTMSSWIPSIFYKIPWQKIGIKMKNVEKYNNSMEVIKKKHRL